MSTGNEDDVRRLYETVKESALNFVIEEDDDDASSQLYQVGPNCGYFYRVGPMDTMMSIVSGVYGMNEKTAILVRVIGDLNDNRTLSVNEGDILFLPDKTRALEYAEHLYFASMTLIEMRRQKKIADILNKR